MCYSLNLTIPVYTAIKIFQQGPVPFQAPLKITYGYINYIAPIILSFVRSSGDQGVKGCYFIETSHTIHSIFTYLRSLCLSSKTGRMKVWHNKSKSAYSNILLKQSSFRLLFYWKFCILWCTTMFPKHLIFLCHCFTSS